MKYIYLSGVVDPFWGEITQKSVADLVTAARAENAAEEITVVINSPGGDVAEGINIYNYLRREKVNTEISGVAASIASVIALAGQHVAIYDNSTMFIHHAWCYLGDGNADDARTAADRMDAIDGTLASIYASRGLDQEKITELMDGLDGKGSMITAAQALDLGLVDEILDPAKAVAACMTAFRSHPHHTKTSNKEDTHMAAEDPAIIPAPADPQAACGDPGKAEEVETTKTVETGDDEDVRIAELEKKIAELEKKLGEKNQSAAAQSAQSAQLKASVKQARTQAAAQQNGPASWAEAVKKHGYAKACELFPDLRESHMRAEFDKGSIR
jgi:ATP-dependent protease ClpP protease subunit